MAIPLRHQIPYAEFDYQTLLTALKDYKRPRDRITRLLRKGTIIRVKKGIYVFGEYDRRGPIHPEVLANLIYGPSYVSLEYALQQHGLIPERVQAVTSVTVGRSREFTTPVGRFTYRAIPLPALRAGVERVDIGRGRCYLRALPEKALADKVQSDKRPLRSRKSMATYLLEDLRLEPEALGSLNRDLLADYAGRYRSRRLGLLVAVVDRWRQTTGGSTHA